MKRRVVWTRPKRAAEEPEATAPAKRGRPPTPKERVEKKARDLWGSDVKVELTHERVKGDKRAGELHLPNGVYYVECFIDGKRVAKAWHLKWNRAYTALLPDLERAFERELYGQ
jgi:hypothetical protein